MIKNLGNLTLILNKNDCNKNCPFCIAKSSGKTYNTSIEIDDEFSELENILKTLQENSLHFDRFVLSGNGEPSLYDLGTLNRIVTILQRHAVLFNGIRVHTSGRIFTDTPKFQLFNKLENIEFDILRVSLNPEVDMRILGYKKDYTQTENFRQAKRIKMDVALTDILSDETFSKELENFLDLHRSIKLVRLKELLPGKDNKQTTSWATKHRLPSKQLETLLTKLKYSFPFQYDNGQKEIYTNGEVDLVIGASGKYEYYDKDLLISNNRVMNYQEEEIIFPQMQPSMGENVYANRI